MLILPKRVFCLLQLNITPEDLIQWRNLSDANTAQKHFLKRDTKMNMRESIQGKNHLDVSSVQNCLLKGVIEMVMRKTAKLSKILNSQH